MAAQEWDSTPLQPALRLIHCIQKERGASCALVGSLALPKNASESSSEVKLTEKSEHQYEDNLRSVRAASNSALSSFYKSGLWLEITGKNTSDNLDIATMLYWVRQVVDGGGVDGNEYVFFHDVIVEFNSFLTTIVKVFVEDKVSNRKKGIRRKINAPKMENESKRNAKVAVSLLDLIISFVTLKENLGIERSLLGGLMANGINDNDDSNEHIQEEEKPKNDTRLNIVVNDLVVVVENQHRIMRDLKKQTGLDIRGGAQRSSTISLGATSNTKDKVDELLFDDNYCTLLKLVGESIRPSDA